MKVINVNLNKERKEILNGITILPLADIHIGDANCNMKLVKETIERIKNEPNTYTILNGDICNCALKNSKSDIYSEQLTPLQEMNKAVELLKDIKNKILVMTTGNHEDRIYKEVGLDLTYLIAKELGIEDRYSNGWWYLFLQLGEYKKNKPVQYEITGYHGYGGGGTSGGKLNRAIKMENITIADIYLMSHVHQNIATKGCIYVPDDQNKIVVKKDQYYAITNSFLEWDNSYAEKMGLPPSNNSTCEIELDGHKKKVKIIM